MEDNLFVLTQAIEQAHREDGQLFTAFLDISKAYDTVDLHLLWSDLQELGLAAPDVELLKNIYADVEEEWEGHKTEPIPVSRGLRQGYPLSPFLFMLYVTPLERALERSGRGFNISYPTRRGEEIQRIPGLMYADDVVLMADTQTELQYLLDVCGKVGTHLKLHSTSEMCGGGVGWACRAARETVV